MIQKRVRCAVYTRKSHQEGLDQEFNSLDQQREAAEAYIESQKSDGWIALPERYDDAAISGATMDRPALRRLLDDIERGLVDVVVIYKIDRLSRSLRDFGHLMDAFDRHGVSFVSVTQRFDTSTSMGKLMLNVLMSFAEFEREVIGERIRDKISAHKRRGKHTGGTPVLGYDTDREAKKLVVNPKEARLVRKIFRRFCALGSTTELARELNRQGHRTKEWGTLKGKVRGGRRWNKSHIYRLLNNKKYIGEVEHKGEVYPGEHEAIVTRKLWDEAHRILSENHRVRANGSRAETPALLRGIIRCGHCDCSMGPTFTRKRSKTYRYYLCVHASKNGYGDCPVRTVAAGDIEAAVVEQLRAVFRTPELVVRTFREVKMLEGEEIDRLRDAKVDIENRLRAINDDADGGVVGESAVELQGRLATIVHDLRALESVAITERDVIDALERLDPVWDELFPAEQARIVQLLIERVEVHPDSLHVRFYADGLRSLVAEIGGGDESQGKGATG
jgi:site-specific DNA recombinase